MKVYLLDTNIASALWDVGDKYNSQALDFVRDAAARGDRIYISRIVIAEIEYGYALYASSQPTRRQQADTAMRAFKSIKEVGGGTTTHWANIRAELYRLFAPTSAKGKIKSVRPEQLVDKTTALTLGNG